MRFQERLSNFFASAYSNNSKYNSSYLLYLRLLFERNNKFKSTFDKLGNVFRNSKWNDLKVQNIKSSLISSWFSTGLSIVLVTLFLFSFFGFTNNTGTIFIPAFLSEIKSLSFFLVAQATNALTLTFIKLGFLLLATKLYLIRLVGFNTGFVFETFSQTPSNTKFTKSESFISNANYTLTSTVKYDIGTLELVRNLSRSTHALARLQQTRTFQNFLDSTQRQPITLIEFLLHETLDFGYAEPCSYKPRQLYHGVNSYKPDFGFKNKSVTLDLKTLNALNNTSFMKNLSNLNVYTNLNQSKQNRWLLKNSLLANTSTTDLFKFTQAKSLVGNTLFDSSSTSHNMWNSSKLTQLSKTSELVNLALFQNVNLGKEFFAFSNNLSLLSATPANLQNFDFFEESRLWTTKKYFFTNQLKSNTLALTNTVDPSLVNLVGSNSVNAKLNLLLSIKNTSLEQQTVLLSFVTNPNVSENIKKSFLNTGGVGVSGDYDHLRNLSGGFVSALTSTTAVSNTSVNLLTQTSNKLLNKKALCFITLK